MAVFLYFIGHAMLDTFFGVSVVCVGHVSVQYGHGTLGGVSMHLREFVPNTS